MTKPIKKTALLDERYETIFDDVASVIDVARASAVRSVNAIMTAVYWLIGQYIVEFEQAGSKRANYGEEIVKRLATDLSARFGRGFSVSNIWQMRAFYLAWPIPKEISGENVNSPTLQTLSVESSLRHISSLFPLPWSAYVRLLSVKNKHARNFYEAEALRGSWSVRQLDRQINSQFYERTALSKNKAAMLKKGQEAKDKAISIPEEIIRDPYVLEFLDLKDEYSESELEESLIQHLETFLLELGGDFCFMGRQRRLRMGDAWYRVDLLFFHRRLRCLVIIDLKMGKFTHADAGQMHAYLNYAKENWVSEGENPPVGLILCAQKNEAVARYALEGLPNKVMAAEYRTTLPEEAILASEIERTREMLESPRRRSRDNAKSHYVKPGKGIQDNPESDS